VMDIDRQRIAAVSARETLGFRYHSGTQLPAVAVPSQALPLITEADAASARCDVARRSRAKSLSMACARHLPATG
jgi:hypothetical protein